MYPSSFTRLPMYEKETALKNNQDLMIPRRNFLAEETRPSYEKIILTRQIV